MVLKAPFYIDKTCPSKKIQLPLKMSKILAKLIGIHFGDGSMRIGKKKDYRVSYCFHIREHSLREELIKIYQSLFSIVFSQKDYPEKNAVELWVCSKQLAYYLNQNFKVPFGKKIDLRIPEIIKSDESYLKAFFYGLFLTDGSYFLRKCGKYKYPVIKITNRSLNFILEIVSLLQKLGFRAKGYPKNKKLENGAEMVLNGKTQCKKWFDEIGKKKEKVGPLGFEFLNDKPKLDHFPDPKVSSSSDILFIKS